MTKIVVLNSGGFDSTVLLHYVKEYYPSADEYHDIFFSYGQISEPMEKKCSKENSDRLGYIHHEISLPKFIWTSNKFYDKDSNEHDSQFLEYRNLVFLSYAFSLANSIGADKIFMAVLKSIEGSNYLDCSRSFFEAVNSIDPNIEVVTPFADSDKIGLAPYAFKCGITLEDFNSCDTPHSDGKPCGKCLDCESIKDIEFYLKGSHTPTQAFLNRDFEAFKRLTPTIDSSSFLELRVIINNDCQLSCPHCFHGFDKLKQEPLSLEEWEDVVRQSLKLGFNSLHFGGKEPLFDNKILDFLHMVEKVEKETDSFYKEKGVVTNGINFVDKSRALKEAGLTKVYFSVDEALGKPYAELHSVFGLYEKNITTALNEGFEVEVFVDLHDRNFNVLPEIFDSLSKLCVKHIHVRTIRNVGGAESIPPLKLEQVDKAVSDIEEYSLVHQDIHLEMNMGIYYTYGFLTNDPTEDKYHTTKLIGDVAFYQSCFVTDSFCFMPEFYCGKFSCATTITADGYALGCGCEVCYKDYDKHSVGNVRDKSFLELTLKGKEKSVEENMPYFEDRSYLDCMCKVLK